jgi:GAF domain-containing protein/HAMP domain-containing protein
LLGLEPAFRQLVLVGAAGQPVAQASRLSQTAGSEMMERLEVELLAQTGQGERYISPVYIDDITYEPLMVVAVPAQDVFGDYQGTLVAEVNLKFMWDLVDRLEVGETGVAFVVDRQGKLLAFGDVTRVLAGENLSHLNEVAQFLEAGEVKEYEHQGELSPGINGETVLGTYVPLGRPDWAVVTELPAAEAYADVIRNIAASGAIILIVAALAGLAGIYLARRLAAPLHNLTATVSRIAGGETRLQAAVEGSAEVVQLAEAFNGMTSQLHFLLSSLEEQVQERTAELALSMEVGQRALAMRSLDELLPTITEFIRDRFDLYYTHVYFIDDIGENLVIRAGTGEVGRQLLARRHTLPVGAGSIVGQVAASGQSIVVTNTETSDIHKPNPLLPDTRSELAVPLVVEGQVIGVLDMQSDRAHTFTQENLTVFEAMATQLAISIDSARQWTLSQEAQRRAEEAVRQLTRETWTERLSHDRKGVGFVYDLATITPVSPREPATEATGFSAPLVVQSQQIGRLAVAAPPNQSWTEDEQNLIDAVAEQLAQKAENLRLFEQTQDRATREHIARQIADRVRASRDIETALKTAAEELSKALGTSRAVIDLDVALSDEGNGH